MICCYYQMSEDHVLAIFANLDALGYGKDAISKACENGYLKLVQHLYNTEITPLREEKINHGYRMIFTRHNTEEKQLLEEKIVRVAAQFGHLHILKWAHEMEFLDLENAVIEAIANKHNDIVKWLCKNNAKDVSHLSYYPCEVAAAHGNLEILKWLSDNIINVWHADICIAAAQNGHLNILKYLRENGCPWNEGVCAVAADNNHLEILQWARSQDCPWDYEPAVNAASKNHQQILKWAIENGCILCSKVYSGLLKNKSENIIEMLKFLYEHKCPMDDASIFAMAAANQPLKVLQWLRAHQCPWDSSAPNSAALKNKLENLKWLLDNGCPYEPDMLMENALFDGHFEIAQYCLDRGFSFPATICRDLSRNPEDHVALWWALSKGAHWGFGEEEKFKDNALYHIPAIHYHALRYLQTKYNVYPHLITEWLKTIDDTLPQIFYEDLTGLIKNYL